MTKKNHPDSGGEEVMFEEDQNWTKLEILFLFCMIFMICVTISFNLYLFGIYLGLAASAPLIGLSILWLYRTCIPLESETEDLSDEVHYDSE